MNTSGKKMNTSSEFAFEQNRKAQLHCDIKTNDKQVELK